MKRFKRRDRSEEKLSWEQLADRTWTCPEGGMIWRVADGWAWCIAGRNGIAAGLAVAIVEAGDAWRSG